MDSTSKLLVVLVVIASGDYFLYRILNLITWKIKGNKPTRESRNIDKEFWKDDYEFIKGRG